LRYSQKMIFNMAAVRHFEFAKLWYFVTWPTLEPKSTVAHQISLESDDPRLRYGDETIFKMAAVRHLEFLKFGIWSSDLGLNVIVLQSTKFRVNRTINRGDIAKIRFSIWRPSAILDLLLCHHITSENTIMFLTLCQIFKYIVSDILGLVSSFWHEIAILGAKFDILGVNRVKC